MSNYTEVKFILHRSLLPV